MDTKSELIYSNSYVMVYKDDKWQPVRYECIKKGEVFLRYHWQSEKLCYLFDEFSIALEDGFWNEQLGIGQVRRFRLKSDMVKEYFESALRDTNF